MLKPLVSLEDLTADAVSEAKDDGRINENEAKMLLAYRTGRIGQISARDVWTLRIRLTERTRLNAAWALGRHYENMASTLRRLVGCDGAQGVTFRTTEGVQFVGTVMSVGPADAGWFVVKLEFAFGACQGVGSTFHFDEIPVCGFSTYNR